MGIFEDMIGFYANPDKAIDRAINDKRIDLAVIAVVGYVVLQFILSYTSIAHLYHVNVLQQVTNLISSFWGPGYAEYAFWPITISNLKTIIINVVMSVIIILLVLSVIPHWLAKIFFGAKKNWFNPDTVIGVGYAFMAWIPILVISMVLLFMVPSYTQHVIESDSGIEISYSGSLWNSVFYYAIIIVTVIGWVLFGIGCILALKHSDGLKTWQAVAVVLVLLLIVASLDQGRKVIALLKRF